MSYSNGPNASAMDLVQHVIGTVDEVKKAGLDLGKTASCSEQVKGSNQGCAHYHNCIFAQMRNGGFRGKNGYRNVGYFHQTHEGTRVENENTCEWFMDKMYERMRAGKRDREDGKNGEIIKIIAIEPGLDHPLSGKKICRSTIVNENEGTNLPHKWRKKFDTSPVRKVPRLGQRGSSTEYDVLLGDRLAVLEAEEEAAERAVDESVVRVKPEVTEAEVEATAEPVED